MISRSQTKFPTFIIFLIFSNNPIAGCYFASPGPPDLEHIWGPKGQPVYGLFYITIICNFYEIYAIFDKLYSRMRFGLPMVFPFGAYLGSKNGFLYMGYWKSQKHAMSSKIPWGSWNRQPSYHLAVCDFDFGPQRSISNTAKWGEGW